MTTKINAGTIARTVVLVVALLNQVLAIAGKNVLPWTNDQIYQGVTATITVVTSIIAWYKNNSFTFAAIKGDEAKEQVKQQIKAAQSNTQVNVSAVPEQVQVAPVDVNTGANMGA